MGPVLQAAQEFYRAYLPPVGGETGLTFTTVHKGLQKSRVWASVSLLGSYPTHSSVIGYYACTALCWTESWTLRRGHIKRAKDLRLLELTWFPTEDTPLDNCPVPHASQNPAFPLSSAGGPAFLLSQRLGSWSTQQLLFHPPLGPLKLQEMHNCTSIPLYFQFLLNILKFLHLPIPPKTNFYLAQCLGQAHLYERLCGLHSLQSLLPGAAKDAPEFKSGMTDLWGYDRQPASL